VIPQASGKKSWHEGAGLEADADPLAFCRTIKGSCCGLRATERDKALSSQSGDGHFEAVGCNRKKSVRPITVAAPNLLNERMIRVSILEVDELALVSNRFIQAGRFGHSHLLPSPYVRNCTNPDYGFAQQVKSDAKRKR
jgi:hypothetical protein